MKKAAVVLIIKDHVSRDPRVLVVTNRRFGGYSLPGGKSESEEDLKVTARRELEEETGLHVSHSDLSLLVRAPNTINGEVCEVSIYFARAAYKEIHDREEGTKHAWMRWTELLDASPFRAFYEKHFPDHIGHLRGTLFLGG